MIWFRLAPYIAAAAIGAGGIGYVAMLRGNNARLEADVARLNGRLSTCSARINNIEKDRESDAKIDAMPDLHDVPPGWLLPETGTGGGD